MFRRTMSILIMLIISSFVFYSCSSGGGGGNTETATITVTANQGDGAYVKIYSYSKDGSKKYDEIDGTLQGNSSDFQVKLSKDGGYIVVNISKEGFADWSKKINFESPQNITVSATLQPVAETIIDVQGDTVQIASKKYIKLALVKTDKGKKIVKAGKISSLSADDVLTIVEIPTDIIPSDVKAIRARMNSFDPVEDASLFPGEYKDNKGNKIVSLGWDFIDITDAKTGKKLSKLSSNMSKTQTDTIRIYRFISESACSNLIEDFCKGQNDDPPECNDLSNDELNGFNVPVYVYDSISGTWMIVGIGTVDINGDNVIDQNDQYTGQNIVQLCENGNGLWIYIAQTSDNFDFNYHNLDYPITTPPEEICLFVNVTENGNPVSGIYLSLQDDDYDQSFWFGSSQITDQNGNATLTFYRTVQDEDTTLLIVYPTEFEETFLLGEYPVDISTLTKDENGCYRVTLPVQTPEKCKVIGKVLDENTSEPLSGIELFITDNRSIWITKTTDENGEFEAVLPCEIKYYVYTIYGIFENLAEFRPDGLVSYDEKEDKHYQDQPEYKYIVELEDIYIQEPLFDLFIYINGNGSVMSEDESIYCENSLCTGKFKKGSQVTLIPLPDEGYTANWEFCEQEENGNCKVTIDTPYEYVIVNFVTENQYTLSVQINGNGYVMSSPGDIHCTQTSDVCEDSFNENQQVTLTAVPLSGYAFDRWSGDCSPCGSNTTCQITMDNDKSCIASFVEGTPPPATVNMTGVWEGSYTGNDGSSGQICVELQQTDGNLSGNLYIAGQGYAGEVSGTVNNQDVTFGVAGGVLYEGTVSGDSASGTYDGDRDGTADGQWQVSKTDKTSCEWGSNISNSLSVLLGLTGLPLSISGGVITEVAQVSVNNNGSTENDWYAVAQRSNDSESMPTTYLIKSDSTQAFILYDAGTSVNAVYILNPVSGTPSIYTATLSSGDYSVSNETYSSSPVYQSPCNEGAKYIWYKGSVDVQISATVLNPVTTSETRTFSMPQTNIPAYKLETQSCP